MSMTPSDGCDHAVPGHREPDAPPRAFAQGTGVLLQTVGMVLFLSTCCVCSSAGAWDPMLSRPQVFQQLGQNRSIGVTLESLFQQPAKAGVMLMVMFMTVGGLAMAGFGLGLQAQKPRSAWASWVTCALMLVVLAVAGVGVWSGSASWLVRLWHACLTGVMAVMLGFTHVALRQVLGDPPPPDMDVLPPDYKIPYSYHHQDSPQERLAQEVAQRRARLEAEQRALEKLQRQLDGEPDS